MILTSARKAAAEGRGDDAAAPARRGARADRAQHPRPARRAGRPRPVRLRGADLRDRDRELRAGLEAPLRPRGAGRRSSASTCPPRPPGSCSASPRRRSSTPAATPAPTRCRSRCARSTRDVELRVTDDGDGFGNDDPLGAAEPGHLGPREHARARRAARRHARHRDVRARHASARAGRRCRPGRSKPAPPRAPGVRRSRAGNRLTRTGIPLRCAIPASRSRSSGSRAGQQVHVHAGVLVGELPAAAVAPAVRQRDRAGRHLVGHRDRHRHARPTSTRAAPRRRPPGRARRRRRDGRAAPARGRRASAAARCASTSCASAARAGRSAAAGSPDRRPFADAQPLELGDDLRRARAARAWARVRSLSRAARRSRSCSASTSPCGCVAQLRAG